MKYTEQLAKFVSRASFGDLSSAARMQLKIRVLDSLGCAIGAIGSDPVQLVRKRVEEFDGIHSVYSSMDTSRNDQETPWPEKFNVQTRQLISVSLPVRKPARILGSTPKGLANR